jgi:hypothetical protein
MSIASAPANSANVIVNFAWEDPACGGVADPNEAGIFLQPIGAVTGQPIPAVIETGRATGTGFKDSSILGPLTTANDLGTAADPKILAYFFRGLTRDNMISDIVIDAPKNIRRQTWKYDPNLQEILATIRYGLQDIAEPLIWRNYGTALDTFTVSATSGAFVEARIGGQSLRYSRYSEAAAEVANTGTHAGPQMAGQPRSAQDGFASYLNKVVWVKVEAVGDPNTPLGGLPYTPTRFKVEVQDPGVVPTWGGIDYTQRYFQREDESYMAAWIDCRDQDGVNIGTDTVAGDKAPAQIILPGTLTDTSAALAVGDVWSFVPRDIPLLTPTFYDTSGFTLAHIYVEVEDPETGQVEEFERDDAQVAWSHALEMKHGGAHPYGTRHDRTAEQMLRMTFTRGLSSPLLQDARNTGKTYNVRLRCVGAQWPGVVSIIDDTPAPQRLWEIYAEGMKVVDNPRTIAGSATVTEAPAFETSAQGVEFTTQDEVA